MDKLFIVVNKLQGGWKMFKQVFIDNPFASMDSPALYAALFLAFTTPVHADVAWTRLRGTIKGLNREAKIVTIENSDKDVLTITADQHVTYLNKKGRAVEFKDLELDQRITLIRIPMEKPKEDVTETYEEMNRGLIGPEGRKKK